MNMKIRGMNVFDGLAGMLRQGMVDDPMPDWLAEAHSLRANSYIVDTEGVRIEGEKTYLML